MHVNTPLCPSNCTITLQKLKESKKIDFIFFLINVASETNQITRKGQTMKNRFHY